MAESGSWGGFFHALDGVIVCKIVFGEQKFCFQNIGIPAFLHNLCFFLKEILDWVGPPGGASPSPTPDSVNAQK